ncbi:type II toxin-antitoxin system VapC family toxin [soil metagenome]
MFLLDTNVCVGVLKDNAVVVNRFGRYATAELRLCSVVKAELYYGARAGAAVAKNLATVERFCRPFESLPFDDSCAKTYGTLRADLRQRGQLIGPNDLMIAAIALTHELTLVTHNTREFERVPGLMLEDWETSA